MQHWLFGRTKTLVKMQFSNLCNLLLQGGLVVEVIYLDELLYFVDVWIIVGSIQGG